LTRIATLQLSFIESGTNGGYCVFQIELRMHLFKASMPEYWCRFLDGRGRVLSSEKLIAATDEDAIAKVRAIVLAENRNGFELWDGTRNVDTSSERAG
jgi:hypothetical protein